ncbi:halocarboxylic acid dehydrogenase DehI family protein [Salibacterium aidingense]|uniref:halocarboxylic acid dehydrogenase DehI family protein n=1 Tax=Salibacterium aidingense TaxID=384933 RepID=UPI0004007228|nr:halocarboxylic acid dehydrogenase DehI family protein [Salibacterium aidingense]
MDGYGVPEIFEENAFGLTEQLYRDIKYVLKVPIVNFIFRTLALYEPFLSMGWQQIRPNMLTINMEQAAETLRYPNISMELPDIRWENYYSTADIKRIRETVYTFNYVNPKLLLIASAWIESLSYRPVAGKGKVEGFIPPGVLTSLPDITLIQIPSASKQVQMLLHNIATAHHGYEAASDFRALARYPYFLATSWNYLRPNVESNEYTLIQSDLKNKAIRLVHNEMPFLVNVTRETLRPYMTLAQIAGVMGVLSMFREAIAGLIVDGEFFRRILE